MADVPGAVANVDLGGVEIGDPEPGTAGSLGDPHCRLWQQLHEADRSAVRARLSLELALLVDHRRQQRRVEPVVAGVAADDLAVVEWVPEPVVPRGPGDVD